jgi:hypothetical protein
MHDANDPASDRIVRGPLALTTYLGTLTATEVELLQRLTGPSAPRRPGGTARPGRSSGPVPAHPRTEAA